MIPPADYTSRPYAADTDPRAMAQLLFATRTQGQLVDFPSPRDLDEIVAQLPDRYKIELWENNAGMLAGFAIVDLVYNNLYFELAVKARDSRIAAEMIDWADGCLRHGASDDETSLALDTACREDDAWRLALLQQHGFVPQPVRTLAYTRSLAEPVDVPQLPAGFRIRAAAGEQEAEALTALHRAAFGTEHMTVEERLAMMRVPDYDPALDLLAVAPEGSPAAYCFCCISHEEGTVLGHTDPVATHPRYQRLGLAQALMLTGLRCLQERGAVTAMLGTSSENVAMQRTAESAGFVLEWSKVWLSKPIGSGAGDPKVGP